MTIKSCLIMLAGALLGLLFIAFGAKAVEIPPKTLQIEFTYDGAGDAAATEYRLYLDQDRLCWSPADTVQATAAGKSFDCSATIPAGWHVFSMTAMRADGFESNHSPGFSFHISDKGPDMSGPTVITITINKGLDDEVIINQ